MTRKEFRTIVDAILTSELDEFLSSVEIDDIASKLVAQVDAEFEPFEYDENEDPDEDSESSEDSESDEEPYYDPRDDD
jgi:hypothetical protein